MFTITVGMAQKSYAPATKPKTKYDVRLFHHIALGCID